MRRHTAFSLMEIILVVVIIGMLAALVVPRMVGVAEKARVKTTRAQLAAFRTALTDYNVASAHFPTTAEGLQALIVKPAGWPGHVTWERFLDSQRIPLDAWGNAFTYRFPGTVEPTGYELFSWGPDGKEGTEDDIDLTK